MSLKATVGTIIGAIILLFSLPWLLGTVLPWFVGILLHPGDSNNVARSGEVIAGVVTPGWLDPLVALASVSAPLAVLFLLAAYYTGNLDA